MEISRDGENICLKDGIKIIEMYNFAEEINFKKLVEYLLELNLSKKVEVIDNVKDATNDEENLIGLINKIIHLYNSKIDDLKDFNQLYNK